MGRPHIQPLKQVKEPSSSGDKDGAGPPPPPGTSQEEVRATRSSYPQPQTDPETGYHHTRVEGRVDKKEKNTELELQVAESKTVETDQLR